MHVKHIRVNTIKSLELTLKDRKTIEKNFKVHIKSDN